MMKATVFSLGSILPASTSFLRTAMVVPPAVSVKMPSVSARSFMPAIISASVTSSMLPLVLRGSSRAYMPSALLPMAMDLAMVLGLTGVMKSRPSLYAWEMGEQPSACAPLKRTSLASTSPVFTNSLKPL